MNRKIRCIALLLALAMGLSLVLTSCKDANRGHGKTDTPETPGTPDVPDTPEDPAEPDEPLSPAIPQLPEEPEEPKAPEEYVYDYKVWPEEELVPWNDVVEHLFFHQIIAYPELAFDGDAEEKGFDDWMVTVSEFDKILDSLYEKGYILVNMNDVWSEYTNDDGEQRMKRNTLMVPKGKKPLVMSIDDTCYYTSYLTNGFMEKLVIGDDGEIWAYGHDPEGNGVLTQDLVREGAPGLQPQRGKGLPVPHGLRGDIRLPHQHRHPLLDRGAGGPPSGGGGGRQAHSGAASPYRLVLRLPHLGAYTPEQQVP